MAFFCADTLVTSLKAMESMPNTKNRLSQEQISPLQLDSLPKEDQHLLKLNLSDTKLDELTAYQLCLGVL